jgi:hypothetical protein
LGLIVYSLGKASVGLLAKLLGVARTTTSDWIRHAAASTPEPTIAPAMQDIEFAEMWHVIRSTNEPSGFFKPWIVAQGEPVPGYAVVVMRQRSNDSMIKANIERMVYFIQITGTRLPRSYLKNVTSLATHTPMRVNAIIPLRDTTSPV